MRNNKTTYPELSSFEKLDCGMNIPQTPKKVGEAKEKFYHDQPCLFMATLNTGTMSSDPNIFF